MRLIYTLLIIVIVATLYFLDQPQHWQSTISTLGNVERRILNDKEIRIAGIQRLKEDEVKALLPLDRSNAWWLANKTTVETKLLENPWVQKAEVKACEGIPWSCFEIKISERDPGFVALVGRGGWLLAKDGSVLKTVSAARVEKLDPRQAQFPIIRGLGLDEVSPDITRALALKIAKAIEVIETTTKHSISEVEFDKDYEATIQFKDLPFRAQFDLSLSGEEGDTGSAPSVSDQAQRLKRVLTEFGQAQGRIVKVDLAFDKIAVVRTSSVE